MKERKIKGNKEMILLMLILTIGLVLIIIGLLKSFNKNISSDKKIEYYEKMKYKVKKGETLEDIAIKTNIFEDELIKINKLKSNEIKENQELEIKNITIYKISKNETMESICNKFYITPNTIKKANNLKNDSLKGHKTILIPNTYAYEVKPGDNLKKISKQCNCTEKEIKQINNIKTNKIKSGNILVIPKKIGVKKYDNHNITKEEDISFNKINMTAEGIYDRKEYLNYPQIGNTYYMVSEILNDVNPEIKDYLYPCPKEHPLVYFDLQNKEKYENYPIKLTLNCR